MKTEKKSYREPKKVFWRSISIILFLSMTLSIMTYSVCAHSPATMTVTYNLETRDLQVTISHKVSSPTNHYIVKVEIKKNGELYNTSIYTNQPTNNTFSYSYKVNATANDVIDVYAFCNQGGSKTAQYEVGKDNNGNDTSTPGFELILFLGAVIVSLILLRKKYS